MPVAKIFPGRFTQSETIFGKKKQGAPILPHENRGPGGVGDREIAVEPTIGSVA